MKPVIFYCFKARHCYYFITIMLLYSLFIYLFIIYLLINLRNKSSLFSTVHNNNSVK
jgi:hypothetical protein